MDTYADAQRASVSGGGGDIASPTTVIAVREEQKPAATTTTTMITAALPTPTASAPPTAQMVTHAHAHAAVNAVNVDLDHDLAMAIQLQQEFEEEERTATAARDDRGNTAASSTARTANNSGHKPNASPELLSFPQLDLDLNGKRLPGLFLPYPCQHMRRQCPPWFASIISYVSPFFYASFFSLSFEGENDNVVKKPPPQTYGQWIGSGFGLFGKDGAAGTADGAAVDAEGGTVLQGSARIMPNDSEPIREGFMCPICLIDLRYVP